MSQNLPGALTTAPLPWYRIWFTALTQPSVAAYENLARLPNASLGVALLWMWLSAWAGLILAALGQAIFNTAVAIFSEAASSAAFAMAVSLVWGFVGTTFSALLSVLWFFIATAITQAIARLFGATGNFTRLAFVYATYSAPMAFITGALTVFSILGYCLAFPLAIYGFVLSMIAVRAVDQISWGGAFTASALRVVLTTMILMLLACLLVALVGALLVPWLSRSLPMPLD